MSLRQAITPRALAVATAALALLSACPEEDNAEVDLVIGNVTSSLQSILLLAQLAEIAFEVDPALATTPLGDAPPIALGDLSQQIDTLAGLLDCPSDPVVTTDNATFLEVTIDCVSDAFGAGLVGTLRLEPTFDGVACGNETCVEAINWALSSVGEPAFRYISGDADLMFVEPAVLRFPTDDGERTLRSPRIDVGGSAPSSAEVDARWTAEPCITMNLETVLTETPNVTDAPSDVYPVVFAADDVRVCLGRCPEAGSVDISYAFGALLSWLYGTGDVVTVNEPGGRSRDVALECGL